MVAAKLVDECTKDYRLVYGTPDSEGIDAPYFYTDSEWGDKLDERRSTGSYICFINGASVSWKVKLSSTVCLSTQEAEYNAQTEGTKEALNLRMLLRDLGFGQRAPTTLFCDNKGAITMSLHLTNRCRSPTASLVVVILSSRTPTSTVGM